MAGKTRVNGTAYDIKGGMTRVNGTAYSIKSGMTRVNGTAYTISFGNQSATFQVSGTTNTSYAYAVLEGKKMTSGSATITDNGDNLYVYVSSSSSSYRSSCKVYLNGSIVLSSSGAYTISNPLQYKTITAKFTEYTAGSYKYYQCNITTT